RIQQYRDRLAGIYQDHRVEIRIDGNLVSITDTGIGMTRDDLSSFFWSIGKSGKHTAEAKSAGVVGTFGIGGMANFGVCTRLDITTRPHTSHVATVTYAERARLSAKEDCVFYTEGRTGEPAGTTVRGTLAAPIASTDAAA